MPRVHGGSVEQSEVEVAQPEIPMAERVGAQSQGGRVAETSNSLPFREPLNKGGLDCI
jgi:hypothetical protein